MKLETKEDVKQLLENLKLDRAVVTAEIPPVDPREVPLYQVMKVRAAERVRDAEIDYRRFVEQHMGAIIVQGPPLTQEQFAQLAEKLGSTITFRSQKMYQDIVARAFYSMGGTGNFGVDQIQLIFSEIRLKCRTELNIFRLRDPDMTATAGTGFKDIDDLANRVRAAIRRTNSLLFTSSALYKTVGDSCLANPNSRTLIPVVITGVPPEELANFDTLLSGRNVVVDVEDVEDLEATVTEAFVQLKDLIKKN